MIRLNSSFQSRCIAVVALIGCVWSSNSMAEERISKEGPRSRVVCMSMDNIDKLRELVQSPEGRAKINEVKDLLASKDDFKSTSRQKWEGPSIFTRASRGRVTLSESHREKCRAAFAVVAPNVWSIRKMDSDWWLDPWGNYDPPYFDFGPFGSYEGGSYMEDAGWWGGRSF